MFRGKEGLPRGYRLVRAGITASELAGLMQDVESFDWGHYPLGIEEDCQEMLIDSLATTGVRGPWRQLVGIGFLNGDREDAALGDLAVHPDHRHKGIGRVLVRKRVEIAKDLGIRHLKTNLVPSNTLRQFYHELGFETGGFSENILTMDLK